MCRRTRVTMLLRAQHATLILACGFLFGSFAFLRPTTAAIIPVYQYSEMDATWTHQGNGVYTVPTAAESYPDEIWERPIEDNKWTENATTRTSTGKYYAFGDLKSAQFGVGTNAMDGMDYLFVNWQVVGGFVQDGNSIDSGVGLKGHYYFYFEVPNKTPRAVEVTDATGLANVFGHSNNLGKVKVYTAGQASDVYGTSIQVTEENGVSFSNGTESVAGDVRADTGTSVVEVAVKLSSLGLVLSDFNTIDWAYAGNAVSNPSSAKTDLFANDEYRYAPGQGQEYDTVGFTIPEPNSIALASIALFAGLIAYSRRFTACRGG
jgi:hypothetical protein